MQPQNQNSPGQPGVPPQIPAPHPVAPISPLPPAPVSIPQPVPPQTPPAPVAPIPAPLPVQPQPQQIVAPVAPQSPAPVQVQPVALDEDDTFDDGIDDDEEAMDSSMEPVSWEAKEYIHQEKSQMWFIIFGVVLVVMMGAAVLLMKSWSFAILLLVIAAVIIVFAKRPPRLMTYSLSDKGLHIGDSLHTFSDFKAFGVIRDGEEYSVMLIPTKRFLPGTTVYFPEESGEEIVDVLGSRLPMQELHLDWLDRFVRTLRL